MKKIKVKTQQQKTIHKEFDTIGFVNRQRKIFFTVLGIVVSIVVAGTGIYSYMQINEKKASLKLSKARTSKDIGNVINEISGTRSRAMAMLFLARKFRDEGNIADAMRTYNRFINEYPKHIYTPMVYLEMAYCMEETGDFNNALVALKRVNDEYPNTIWVREAAERYNRISRFTQNKT